MNNTFPSPSPSGPQARARGLQPEHIALVGLLLAGLCVVGVVLLRQLPSGHGPRIIGMLLAIGLGLVVAIAVVRQRRWRAALAWAAAGSGLAMIAWWFMPTTHGLSLWSAHRQADRLIAELKELPAGDFPGYQQGSEARLQLATLFQAFQKQLQEAQESWAKRTAGHLGDQLMAAPAGDLTSYRKESEARQKLGILFPALRSQVYEAEQTWGTRTADRQVADLEALPPGDSLGFSAGLAARKELATLLPALQPRLGDAERAWGERTAKAAVAKAELLFQTDPAQASAQLQQAARDLAACGENPPAQKHLLAARKRAVLAYLDEARRQAQALVKENRFQAAADTAKRLEDTLNSEAKTVGASAELATFHESYRFLAELARTANKEDPK